MGLRAAVVALCAALSFVGPASACGLRLLLALDVSASLSDYEYNLQRTGLAQAFRDPDIVAAILGLGGVRVAVTQWASPHEQQLAVDWLSLRSAGDIRSLADRIDSLTDPFPRGATAIGNALIHAGTVIAADPMPCRRTVIDVSGDGATNTGIHTGTAADALAALGIVINGLVIMVEADKGIMPPDAYYLRNVLRGPGAFLETARTFNDYPEAIRRKLLREILPDVAMLRP